MTNNLIEMQNGEYAWAIAGIIGSGAILEELEKWQAYDFTKRKWMPAKDYKMFWLTRTAGQSFVEALRVKAEPLPPEATVYYYKENECFGALRPIRAE